MTMSIDLFKAIQNCTRPSIEEVNRRYYSTVNLSPIKNPLPAEIDVSSLSAVVDYLNSNIDQLSLKDLIIHIKSPTNVAVLSSLESEFKQRACFLGAISTLKLPAFDEFIDAERFNIFLQSSFADTPYHDTEGTVLLTDKSLLLKYVGNVTSGVVNNIGDDGVTQEATVRISAAKNANVALPNPVVLRPYRTFNEVEQPASAFVFRAKDGPKFALFEADNGAWINEAVQNIKNYFKQHLPEITTIA